ncbi:hypothetical protein [Candidatus Nitrosocosmicus sp. T]
MLGFENTSDLLVVAIIAQTIAIALIILIIYFKINKIHLKNISLNEKIEYKISNIESKLSYLYDQVLTISTNQDKFGSSVDSIEDPACNYRFKESTDYESDSLDQSTDPTLENQTMTDSETIDARQSTIPKPNILKNNSIPIPGTVLHSPSTVESIYTSKTSVPSITPKSYLSPDYDPSMRVSTRNNPYYSTAQDKPINVEQNDNEPLNKCITDNDFPIEKNTNPEIEKIEQEILTTLKRLGGNDEEDSVSYGGGDGDSVDDGSSDDASGVSDIGNPDTPVKKLYKKSKELERVN